jgi:hypothetical protein
VTSVSARDLLAANFEVSPYDHIEELRQIGERKARTEGVAYQLDQERKIVLSRIQNELAVAHATENLSEAKLDRMSRADTRYENHIRRLAVAIEHRETARSDYWAVKSLLEWDRASIAHLNSLASLDRP